MDVLNNIGFDWQVALANFVSFLIIFAILKRWVFGPVQTIIEKRRATIQEGVERSKESEAILNNAQEHSQKIIREAKQEANNIVAGAKGKGDNMVEAAVIQAEEEALKVAQKERKALEQELKNAQRELEKESAFLVSRAVQKILNEEVNQEKDKDITRRALKELQAEVDHA